MWEGNVKAAKSGRRCFEASVCFFDCCVARKLISSRIRTSEGGELGGNPAATAGWVKSRLEASRLCCVDLSSRSLCLTAGSPPQSLPSRACMRPAMGRWPAAGRWRCGAAARAARTRKPFGEPGASLCWRGY